MKNGIRLAAIGGALLTGALALSACGSDDNSGNGNGTAAAPEGNCVEATVNAAGSSAQKNAVDEWIKNYTANCAGAVLNYNPSGSGAGIEAFNGKQAAFAGSDSVMKPEEAEAAKTRCAGNPALHLPMVVGPVAIAYNLDGVEGLQLSPETLANIFANKIKKWNDPAIAADNPGVTLPDTNITTVHRADESGTTDNFTKYLAAVVPDIWTFETGKVWTAPGGQGGTKSDGVTTLVKQSKGSIGYVEMSYAENASLSTVKVKNGAGEYTELTADSASKVVAGAQVVGTGNDLALKIDFAAKTPGAYPIVLVTYEIACEKGLTGKEGEFVKSFLTYTASEAGQEALKGLGYAPLPPEIISKVRTSIDAISAA
ncbi:phosphate ABC transporter substrate-binding protein PstS [Actinocorallia sp. API 0066]|uniref:phosphate ABC transporter substrate-binding protein PstS n=1 Tax=Actinocorallia sp. API 0066 TaxID=2896846 RepID=UPI001E639B5E|nr:phosphate ABC transporter substrate-binding protein PstS [Actinocorallia sp. API 0066]MCD0450369.1 phosphate ABC transporter substrate-binding protein PstS [Actinocorallia sp. API 0066]